MARTCENPKSLYDDVHLAYQCDGATQAISIEILHEMRRQGAGGGLRKKHAEDGPQSLCEHLSVDPNNSKQWQAIAHAHVLK